MASRDAVDRAIGLFERTLELSPGYVEAMIALDDLVRHPPGGPAQVVGVHHLGPGDENAPEGACETSFAFRHAA